MHIGTMNRGSLMTLPDELTAAVDSLSAIYGGENPPEKKFAH